MFSMIRSSLLGKATSTHPIAVKCIGCGNWKIWFMVSTRGAGESVIVEIPYKTWPHNLVACATQELTDRARTRPRGRARTRASALQSGDRRDRTLAPAPFIRSEERRVGKECRFR